MSDIESLGEQCYVEHRLHRRGLIKWGLLSEDDKAGWQEAAMLAYNKGRKDRDCEIAEAMRASQVLCSIQELADELNRRCSSIVLACQYFEEDSDAETPTTYSIIEGNFVHAVGLVRLLRARTEILMDEKLHSGEDADD